MSWYIWLKKIILRNFFLRIGSLLTALHILGGALGYVYQVIMGRIMSPAEYALFSSIMALFMFFSAPMGAMSMLITRKVSTLKAHANLFLVRDLFFYIHKVLAFVGVAALLVCWIAAPYLQRYLKADNITPIFIFALILILSIFNVAGISFFQGLQRFYWLGALGLLGVFTKIVISVGFVYLGFGVIGALLGVLFSMILVYAVAMPTLFAPLPPSTYSYKFNLNLTVVKQSIPVLIATIAFAAMTQLDIVLVNWYFSPTQSGLYAAASVLGKAVLYLPGGLILALFPLVSESHAKSRDSFDLFRQSLLVTILAGGAISTLYWFFGDLIIAILYGEKYQGAGEILRWYGFAILPLAVVLIAEQYLIAKRQVLFAWIFLFMLPVELLIIHFWHTQLWMILMIMGLFGSLLAIIGCTLMWRSFRLKDSH